MTNAEVRQRTKVKDTEAVANNLKSTGRPCGKNGPAQMGTSCKIAGRKNRQREK